MANYGIVDCGSNTVRLCIYSVEEGKSDLRRKDVRSLLNHKVMAGLAAQVVDGSFTERGVKKAANIIDEHLRSASYFKCKRLDVVATAFLRNCDNSKQAQRALEETAGCEIELLSAADEAHLGFIGAKLSDDIERGTLVDIGGGSTELTAVNGGHDRLDISLPIGSLSAYANRVNGVLPDDAEAAAIVADCRAELAKVASIEDYRTPTLYGIGGSVRAVAKVCGEAFAGGPKASVVTRADIDRLLVLYREDPNAFAHATLKAVPDRIHTVIPGALVARTLLEDLHADEIRICKYGLREGYLAERILKR